MPDEVMVPLRLLTRKDLCQMWQVGVAALRTLERDGMPHLRIGGQVRYDPVALDAWLAAQRTRPVPVDLGSDRAFLDLEG